ncbi:LysR substrate-binding domain-containing protein [Camelimonas abortus]|uniref:LysR substrate-binding domain-containing protein n=1 Tax=Camelimonas abortus TaxID=1017184 RepID=A0ABV7LCG6_9HYPH
MQDLNDLFYFAKVIEHRGFAAASRALGVPKSTLSRRIAALEERLGVRLLQRNATRFSLTHIGDQYFRQCQAMIAEAEAAQEVIDRTTAEPRGVISVTCPVSLLQALVSPMVARFLAAYPLVTVNLAATNRRVDVIEEGVDVAFRVRFPPLGNSNLVMKNLGDSEQLLVAHPAFLDEHGRPAHPRQAAALPAMDLTRITQRHVWELTGENGDVISVPFQPRYVTDDMAALRDAALNRIGIVQLPEYMVRNHVSAGELEIVLPRWKPKAGVMHLVFASRRGLAPAVRHFIDFMGKEFALASRGAPAGIPS